LRGGTKPRKGPKFNIEEVVSRRTNPNGTRDYLIKWEGSGWDQTTWEPEAHLAREGVQHLVNEYESRQRRYADPPRGAHAGPSGYRYGAEERTNLFIAPQLFSASEERERERTEELERLRIEELERTERLEREAREREIEAQLRREKAEREAPERDIEAQLMMEESDKAERDQRALDLEKFLRQRKQTYVGADKKLGIAMTQQDLERRREEEGRRRKRAQELEEVREAANVLRSIRQRPDDQQQGELF
jgi:hypothetical protein